MLNKTWLHTLIFLHDIGIIVFLCILNKGLMTLHCSLYSSLSITRCDLHQPLSSLCLFLFSMSMSSLYQAVEGLTVIVHCFSGAWMSSTLVSSVSYLSTSIGRSVMFSCKTMDSLKSLRRLFILTDCSLQYLISHHSAQSINKHTQSHCNWAQHYA